MSVLKMPALRQRVAARWRAVLHPLAGRKLPRTLRAHNAARLAAVWPEGVKSADYAQLIARIDTGPLHCGDRIDVFHAGADAFAAVQKAIEGAETEVLVETYILKDDDTGHGLLKLLARAVQRGVKVCVLADAAGSWSTKRKFWLQMETHGIETRLFNPLIGRFRDLLLRDHRKIIVVDRRIAFTGGMNISNEYGSSISVESGTVWRDSHVRLERSSAWEMAVVFNEGWVRAGGTPLRLTSYQATSAETPRIMVLDSRSGRGHQETASVLAVTMAAARQRLWITNAYFAPHPGVLQRMCRAARRGVDVRLLLPGKSDMPLVRRAGHGSYATLLASGVRIFEYQPAMLHAKTLLVDNFVSMIGSSNLDYRSYYFNAECNVLILDAETGEGMAKTFTDDLSHCVEITRAAWSERSWAKKWGDALARILSPLL